MEKLVLTNKVTLAEEAAQTKIERMNNINTVWDVDNFYNSRVSLWTTANGAYEEYSQHLLSDYYDTNGDGVVSVEEFGKREALVEKKVTKCIMKDLTNNGGRNLVGGSLRDKLKACDTKANFFAKSLDMNGDGQIDVKELAFFNKVADVLDGRKDGTIYNSAEQELIDVMIGLTAISKKDGRISSDKNLSEMFSALSGIHKLNPQYEKVINKYLTGKSLSSQETNLLRKVQKEIKDVMTSDSNRIA